MVDERMRRRRSIRAANAKVDDTLSTGTLVRRCECGEIACSAHVEVDEDDYRRARRRDGGYLVAVEHLNLVVDRPVMHVGQAYVAVSRSGRTAARRETFADVRRNANRRTPYEGKGVR